MDSVEQRQRSCLMFKYWHSTAAGVDFLAPFLTVGNIMNKTGTSHRVELATYAAQHHRVS